MSLTIYIQSPITRRWLAHGQQCYFPTPPLPPSRATPSGLCRLLNVLPLELRLQIYTLHFLSNPTIYITKYRLTDHSHCTHKKGCANVRQEQTAKSTAYHPKPGESYCISTRYTRLSNPGLRLLRTCKQVHDEAWPVVYSTAVFDLATPRHGRGDATTEDLKNQYIAGMQRVVCSVEMGTWLLKSKAALKHSGSEYTNVRDFEEMVVIYDNYFFASLIDWQEFQLSNYGGRVSALAYLAGLAMGRVRMIRIRPAKKALQYREIIIRADKKITVRGVPDNEACRKAARCNIIHDLELPPDADIEFKGVGS